MWYILNRCHLSFTETCGYLFPNSLSSMPGNYINCINMPSKKDKRTPRYVKALLSFESCTDIINQWMMVILFLQAMEQNTRSINTHGYKHAGTVSFPLLYIKNKMSKLLLWSNLFVVFILRCWKAEGQLSPGREQQGQLQFRKASDFRSTPWEQQQQGETQLRITQEDCRRRVQEKTILLLQQWQRPPRQRPLQTRQQGQRQTGQVRDKDCLSANSSIAKQYYCHLFNRHHLQ